MGGSITLIIRGVLADGTATIVAFALARLLSLEEFGTYAIVVSLAAMSTPILVSGPAYYLARHGAPPRDIGGLVSSGLVVATLAVIACVGIGITSDSPAIWFGLAVYVCSTPLRLPGVTQAIVQLRFARLTLAQVSDMVIVHGGVLVAVGFGGSIVALALLLPISGVITAVMLWIPRTTSWPRRADFLRPLRRARHDIAQSTVETLVLAGTVPLVGVLLGAEDAGVVRWATLMATPPFVLVGFLGPALYGTLVRLDPDTRRGGVSPVLWLVAGVAAGWAVVVLSLLPAFTPLLFGAQWSPYVAVAIVMTAGFAAATVGLMLRIVLQATHRTALVWSARLLTWALAMCAGILLATLTGDLVFLAAALAAGAAVWAFVLEWRLRRADPFERRALASPALACAVGIASAGAVLISVGGPAGAVAGCALGLAGTGVTIVFTGRRYAGWTWRLLRNARRSPEDVDRPPARERKFA